MGAGVRKMIPFAWRTISREKTRFVITVGGVGFTVILMLFQLGIYQGVKKGAAGYVQGCSGQVWICEKNSNNLIRSSSFLSTSHAEKIAQIPGVGEVTGILRVLTTAEVNGKSVTLFLFGFDPESQLAVPAPLLRGTSRIGAGEIIVDKAFAAKHRLKLGDVLQIKGRDIRLAGICEGTNTVVIQFVFTSIEEARQLLGFPNVVSFYLLNGDDKTAPDKLFETVKRSLPGLAVFGKEKFIQNNKDEMESGVLPVFWIIALFGGILGVAIITLMLYGSVLEKRESFALLKAIGASQKFLVLLVLRQSILGALTGFLAGLLSYWFLTPLITKFVPEITLGLTWSALLTVLAATLFIGTIGSLMPVHKLGRIFPMEVFRQ